MSEQKLNYWQLLDTWIDQAIFELIEAEGFVPGAETALQIRKAIRAKVLESYRNGQAAGPRKTAPARKEPRYAQAKTR